MKSAVVAAASMGASASPPPDYYNELWAGWKIKYNKSSNAIDAPDNFKKNVDFVVSENEKAAGYELGLNQFGDLSNDEFKSIYAGTRVPSNRWGGAKNLGMHKNSGKTLADSVDWVSKGAVTPVKNQGTCGSCWAFSTTGSLEGAWQIATGKLVAFSEQQLVDCDTAKDQGCSGGLMDNAFEYLEKNAMCTEDSYSYKGTGGTCAKSSCTEGIPQGGLTGYMDVKADSQADLMDAVNLGPVSVAIDAETVVQLYFGGVLSSICGTTLDHGVLVVGYGTDNSKDYWKVKNSWGASWGEQGYLRMVRGKAGAGECGILSEPVYPVVKKSGLLAHDIFA